MRSLVLCVMRDVGYAMEEIVDTVPTVCLIDRALVLGSCRFDDSAKISE